MRAHILPALIGFLSAAVSLWVFQFAAGSDRPGPKSDFASAPHHVDSAARSSSIDQTNAATTDVGLATRFSDTGTEARLTTDDREVAHENRAASGAVRSEEPIRTDEERRAVYAMRHAQILGHISEDPPDASWSGTATEALRPIWERVVQASAGVGTFECRSRYCFGELRFGSGEQFSAAFAEYGLTSSPIGGEAATFPDPVRPNVLHFVWTRSNEPLPNPVD